MIECDKFSCVADFMDLIIKAFIEQYVWPKTVESDKKSFQLYVSRVAYFLQCSIKHLFYFVIINSGTFLIHEICEEIKYL